MAKITEYPEAQSFDQGDVILKDGTNGTKKMTVENLKSIIAPIDDTLTQTGKSADAKKVGDEITDVKSAIDTADLVYKLNTHPGYISSDGTIASPSANKEVYTDKIPISADRRFGVSLTYTQARSMWVQYCLYTSDNTFIGRTAIEAATKQSIDYVIKISNFNAAYIAFTWRTFDEANLIVYNPIAQDVQHNITDINYLKYNLGYYQSSFGVIANTNHSSNNDHVSVNIKQGDTYTVTVTSTVISSYQIYAFYADGTNASLYSGTNMSKTYTAAKDTTEFGFYIPGNKISATGDVTVTVSVDDKLYDNADAAYILSNKINQDIGIVQNTFSVTAGTAIDGDTHETSCDIKSGEDYSVQVRNSPFDATKGATFWLVYADGTDEKIFDTNNSRTYRGKAKKTIKAIQFIRGAAGVLENGTCTIIIKRLDNSYAQAINAEICKNEIVKSINHRGYGTAPENTIPAYKLSYKSGFKRVETDVRLTSDGVAVLLHDDSINRTARNSDGTTLSETVNIADITYADALDYDFGIYKGNEYAGTKIPTLAEFITLCRQLSLLPYIELKGTGYTEAQIQGIVDIVIDAGLIDSTTWISFDTTYLSYIKNYVSEARLGVLATSIDAALITTATGLKTTTNNVFIDSYSYTNTEITLCKAARIPLEVWTLDTESNVLALDPYVSGVTSNNIITSELLTIKALS